MVVLLLFDDCRLGEYNYVYQVSHGRSNRVTEVETQHGMRVKCGVGKSYPFFYLRLAALMLEKINNLRGKS